MIEILKKTRRSFVTSNFRKQEKDKRPKDETITFGIEKKRVKGKEARFGIKSKGFKMRRRMKSE